MLFEMTPNKVSNAEVKRTDVPGVKKSFHDANHTDPETGAFVVRRYVKSELRVPLLGTSGPHLNIMRALQFTDAKTGLVAAELPIPQPGQGEIVVKVEAAGLCHSDTTIVHGHGDEFMPLAKRPITLGHEVAGVVTAVGQGVDKIHTGDRVAFILPIHPLEDMVTDGAVGLSINGGYAEYCLGRAADAVPIPDNVGFPAAAVAIDSIATAYHAVLQEARASATSTTAIVGLGGLGLKYDTTHKMTTTPLCLSR